MHSSGRVVDWSASGVVAITGGPDAAARVPVGAGATCAHRLACWLEQLSGATGTPVRVNGAQLLAERAALTGWRSAGRRSAGGASRLLPAADDWIAVSLPRPDDGVLAAALVGDRGDVRPEAPWPGLARWISGEPAATVVAEAAELGIAVGRLAEASGPIPSAGPAARVDVAALVATANPTATLPGLRRGGPGARPLRVLDFSALWAGPLCAQLLGLAGADVVKVETPGRPDGARAGSAPFYDLLHAGHSSVRLDPARREERSLLTRLVAAADVVIEASRPRALAGWGLSSDRAVAAGAVWVSITAHGRTGPAAARIGFGDDIAVAGGLVARDSGGGPLFAGDAIADPLAGLAAATGALLAVARGGGALVDVAMSQVVAATLDELPEPQADGRAAGPIPIAAPVARPVIGTAPLSGADTADVVARWLPE